MSAVVTYEQLRDYATGRRNILCPAHDDRTPSLRVSLGDDDRILLHCHAGCPTHEVLKAWGIFWSDLRPPALRSFNSNRKAASSSHVAVPHPSPLTPHSKETEKDTEAEVEWLLRNQEAGRVEAVAVDLPPLPDCATRVARDVAEFYRRVRGVRLWAGDDRPVPFGGAWVGRYLGLPDTTVWRAIKQLEEYGVLVYVGALPGRGKRGTFLYEPGSASDALPASALPVEADVAARPRVDERDEIREDVAVVEAVAADGREVLEPDDRPAASGDVTDDELIRCLVATLHDSSALGYRADGSS